jgi:hypothetical protein
MTLNAEMQNRIRAVLCFLTMAFTVLFLLQCNRGGFTHDEKIGGGYHLVAVDLSDEMSIYVGQSDGTAGDLRIGETVFAVGWNDRYIVAQQHPDKNRSQTNFYYLDMALDHPSANSIKSVTGPLTAAEFVKRSAALGLPAFTRHFDNLE